MNRIVHIIPKRVLDNCYHGSYKDVLGRIQFFERCRHEYHQLLIAEDRSREVSKPLREHSPTHVLVEYTHHRNILKYIRSCYPDVFVAVRALNIEPLQHFDNYGIFSRQGLLWLLYGMARLFAADLTSVRLADSVNAISEWEAKKYWMRLPGRASVQWLPYFCPEHLVRDCSGVKKDVIACLPASQQHRRSRDVVERFLEFARSAMTLDSKFRYVLTGDLNGWKLKLPRSMQLAGMVEDLACFMKPVKAVAILSPLGYGFKTTVADAVAMGSFAILHPVQYRRCPDVLRKACVELESMKIGSIKKVLEKIGVEFPLVGVNDELRGEAHKILTRDFCQLI